jgi:predicted O-methyltransferase YrrM
MEHFYQKIQGWFAYEFLYTHIVNSCNFKDTYNFVEVGSWKGRSTAYMAVEIVNSCKQIKFNCVDTWAGSEEHVDKSNPSYEKLLESPDGLYNHFLENIEPVKSFITPIRKTSVEASEMFNDNSIDFIMIDAAHDYENVINDIRHWYPKLASGGIISGDDLDWPGVTKAVSEYFNDDFLNIENKIWIKQK